MEFYELLKIDRKEQLSRLPKFWMRSNGRPLVARNEIAYS